jgi:hypothetical protein
MRAVLRATNLAQAVEDSLQDDRVYWFQKMKVHANSVRTLSVFILAVARNRDDGRPVGKAHLPQTLGHLPAIHFSWQTDVQQHDVRRHCLGS